MWFEICKHTPLTCINVCHDANDTSFGNISVIFLITGVRFNVITVVACVWINITVVTDVHADIATAIQSDGTSKSNNIFPATCIIPAIVAVYSP